MRARVCVCVSYIFNLISFLAYSLFCWLKNIASTIFCVIGEMLTRVILSPLLEPFMQIYFKNSYQKKGILNSAYSVRFIA